MGGTLDTHLADELHRTETGHTLQFVEEYRTSHTHFLYQFVHRQGVVVHLTVHDIEQFGEEGITRHRVFTLLRLQTHQTLTVALLELNTLGDEVIDPGTQILGLEGLGHIVVRTILHRLQTTLDSRLGSQQNNGDIVPFGALLDKLRQLQSVHLGHHQIGDHQIQRLGAQDAFGLFAVLGGQDIVFAIEDADEELTHLAVVIHHEDGETAVLRRLFQLLQFVLQRQRCGIGCQRMVVGHEIHLRSKMVFALVQQDSERTTLAHFALHLDMTVVQIHEFLDEVHTDTRTARGATVQFVVAGEAFKQHAAFLQRNADTLVLHSHTDETGFLVQNDRYPLAGRSELEGIAKQVPQYRVHSSAVYPDCGILGAVLYAEGDMLVVRLLLEIGTRLSDQFAQQRLLHLEFHLLVLDLAELQQLVHHTQHTLTVGLHDLQLAANRLRDTLVLQDILHRPDDERQRRTQLMADIGEEAQFDVRHLLLHLHLLTQLVVGGDDIDDHPYHQQYGQGIDSHGPPAQPGRTLYDNTQLLLVVHIRSLAVRAAHMERIVAMTHVGIGDAVNIFGYVPTLVHTVQLVVIDQLIGCHVVYSGILDRQTAAVGYRDGVARQFLILAHAARDVHWRH